MPSSGSSLRSPLAEPRVRRTSYLRPDIERHLLHDDGEVVTVEIAKPPVAAVGPAGWVVMGVAILLLMGYAGPGWWLMMLDITIHQPFLGTVFNYGHLVFESAAQDQGLREIRYVDDPFTIEHTIEQVIQRSGVRPVAVRRAVVVEDDGT